MVSDITGIVQYREAVRILCTVMGKCLPYEDQKPASQGSLSPDQRYFHVYLPSG